MTTAFEFGFKLLRVPAALLVVPLSQALLPELAGNAGKDGYSRDGLQATRKATWIAAGLAAAGFAAMVLIRKPLVSLLFERGEFGEASTAAVALILLSYAPAMLGRVIAEFLSRLLFAMGKVRIPAVASAVAVVANLVICVLLPSTSPELIGLGATIGFALAAITLIRHVSVPHRDA
jgi:putative peptidoglycan lipid II flippase